ncbi:MAG TPA: ester cyclase [Candidatus Binatia bacterium]|jgi:steroid delta-isomerase-like uncharacterized protein
METIIERQRATIAEHLRAENAKEWAAVYDTFIQSENAYFDVVPLSTRFKGISGVKDFYQLVHAALPDFQIKITSQFDTPGCSILELTLAGTHQGEYCGVPASGNSVSFEVAIFYLFGAGSEADKLVAERVYFDNEMLLRQMRGEENAPTGIGLANIAGQSASAGN